MNTKQIMLTITVAAVAAATLTALAFRTLHDNSTAQPLSDKAAVLDQSSDFGSIEGRLEQLEQQLIEERAARQALEKILGQSTDSREKISMDAMSEIRQEDLISVDTIISEEAAEAEIARFRKIQQAQMLKQMQPEFKIQELVNAGFNKDEAGWIVNSEIDVQLEQLQNQYNERRRALNDPDNQNSSAAYSSSEQLRKKLGEDYYERYLQAKGMPTSIPVGSVMNNSPGANAGILPGDDIVAYDNKRVFSVYGLNRMTATGKEGENVLIEVERNGESVQLTIPRGPIGVESNRYGRRR